MSSFTHFDDQGNARMVDVSNKKVTERSATARVSVFMQVARLAGIMASKRTSDLIPLCHPLGLDAVEVDLACDQSRGAVDISATCRIKSRTGVEMEALTAASVAALTVYDMCKAVDRAMRISDLRLTHKAGGKSGEFTQD